MKNMVIEELGSFYVGGHEVILRDLPHKSFIEQGGLQQDCNPNGQFEVGQMYVQYARLADPKAKYPLLMWHGGGLTGVTWETTPDGRPGWRSWFLRHGHHVYVSDSVERGRSSWAQYPEIYRSAPEFTTKAACWSNFRMGPSFDENPEKRETYQGIQFPTECFDIFAKQIVPRWRSMDDWAQAAYDELAAGFSEGCVIMAHSQGANFALPAALANPDKVKALILLEPARIPNPTTTDLRPLSKIPQLILWGDYLEKPELAPWAQAAYYHIYPEYRRIMEQMGGSLTWIDLPQRNIRGNSHMLMMDKNSDAIAQVIQDWMEAQGLMK